MLVRLDVRDAHADLADRLGDRARPADDLAVTAAVTSILDAVRTAATPRSVSSPPSSTTPTSTSCA